MCSAGVSQFDRATAHLSSEPLFYADCRVHLQAVLVRAVFDPIEFLSQESGIDEQFVS
jgi:hypothetical protein